MALRSRLDLQGFLETLLGSRNVYFQPPATIRMAYPCIVYELDGVNSRHADDLSYLKDARYQVTLIDRDPDSKLFFRLMELPKCSFSSRFASDDLNHFVFTLYF